LNSQEIEVCEGNKVDRFYIQRCYQSTAKLLNIKLAKGWQKGRKRGQQQTRAKLRCDVIEANIDGKTALS